LIITSVTDKCDPLSLSDLTVLMSIVSTVDRCTVDNHVTVLLTIAQEQPQ